MKISHFHFQSTSLILFDIFFLFFIWLLSLTLSLSVDLIFHMHKCLRWVILAFFWWVDLSLGWTTTEGVNVVVTLFRSRNHKYSALRGRTDLYHITHPKFRYGKEKVLGTQPHLTHGSASTHCVHLIKGKFNMLF